MLGVEAVVAEEFLLLLIIFRVDEGAIALATDETFAVPTALSVKDEVLDMDGQLTSLAHLSH